MQFGRPDRRPTVLLLQLPPVGSSPSTTSHLLTETVDHPCFSRPPLPLSNIS